MGSVAKKVGGAVTNTFKKPGRALGAFATGGLSEFAQKDPFGAGYFLGPEEAAAGGSGLDFRLDPAQMEADRKAIGLRADEDITNREQARKRLGQALNQQNQDVFKQGMAGTLEDLNSRGLVNSSGVGQEFARQQGDISTNIANQLSVLGASDIDRDSAYRDAALSRQFGMGDFISQANLSKAIGAQSVPQAPSGKANFGTVASGIGALAPVAGLFMGGPAGAAAGTAAANATQKAFPSPVAYAGGQPVYRDQVKRGK